MRKLALVTLLLALTSVNITAFAQKPSVNIVSSTIADAGADTIPLSIRSDFQGAYLNGSDSVVSQIQGIGDWELNMLGSAVRRVNVNFNDLVPGSNPNNLPTPMSGDHRVRFITQCTQYGNNLLNLTTVGQTAICGMIVRVEMGSDVFSLRFFSQNFPGSDNVTVACTEVAAGKCSGWQIQSPNGTGKLTARVQKITTVRGKQVLTDYGKYRFSFDISFNKV